jgi:geranylgeranyl diphosphate synthase, type II
VNEVVTAVDGYLDVFLGERALPANLVEAIRYALLGGGKRLRPVLAWRSCEAVGGKGEDSLPAGAAVELVHAFSLVHDDLPAMDDDDLRRGRPTLHIQSGEAMAILAGDAMLALAFELIVERVKRAELHLGDAMVRELSQATAGMIAGQVYDTLGGLPEEMGAVDRLHLIHRNKTGALIRAACRMGAMCGGGGGADAARLQAVTRYAEAVGLMFQVVDDLLDHEGTAEQTGKRTRKDAAAGKVTFPGVMGVEGSRREVVRLEAEAKKAVEILGPSGRGLVDLVEEMAARRH